MMPDAIAKLLDIMRDETASLRDRINAAVSASRVQKLQLPGEQPPESVQYLRDLVDDPIMPHNFRREAAAALAYYERRSQKAALTFEVADLSEQHARWLNLTNATLRLQLTTRQGAWPADRNILTNDQHDRPHTANPDLTIAAVLSPPRRGQTRKRKAVDDPGGTPILASERDRRAAIMPVAARCAEMVMG